MTVRQHELGPRQDRHEEEGIRQKQGEHITQECLPEDLDDVPRRADE